MLEISINLDSKILRRKIHPGQNRSNEKLQNDNHQNLKVELKVCHELMLQLTIELILL